MDNKQRLQAWRRSRASGKGADYVTPDADTSASEDVSDLIGEGDAEVDLLKEATDKMAEQAREAELEAELEAEAKASAAVAGSAAAAPTARASASGTQVQHAARLRAARRDEEDRRREIEALLPSEADISARLATINQRDHERRVRRLRNLALFAFLPVLLALGYFAFIKSYYYQTETSFAITTVSPSEGISGAAMLGVSTGGGGMTDGYRVRDYLLSEEVRRIMQGEHAYLSHFDGQDMPGASDAGRGLGFYRDRVQVIADQQEGIMTLQVEGVTPEMAVRYAEILLDLGKQKVRDISQAIDEDQMADLVVAEQEARDRLAQAQGRVVEVQQRQAELDPRMSAQGIYTIINGLEVELAEYEAQRSALLANGLSESAFLPRINARIQALERQIAQQQERLVSSREDGTVGRTLAQFEAAMAEREAAQEELAAARTTLEQARLRGLEQRKYLVVISRPMEPQSRNESRFLGILTALAIALAAVLALGWLTLRRSATEEN
ncbi:hypothetical protein [Alteraurantiacibacter aquimixticola]|uniref:Capsule biosynthesis protein n=1 Tax=Alteraurantiacibacter aquimixticola TaxID=2489173 RepID=A0A4T3F167_9SPHN|nr:hypothetical protein [Alteraurantiacibacter aquimixticola]TIX50704.1 hypothetical protein E5222_10670 [Alteraurantiacibacter aquimixticola]